MNLPPYVTSLGYCSICSAHPANAPSCKRAECPHRPSPNQAAPEPNEVRLLTRDEIERMRK
jgi:hypothetical protein